MSILSLPTEFYGTVRQDTGKSASFTLDMTNEIGGLYTVNIVVWTSSAGPLEYADMVVTTRATDPTGVLQTIGSGFMNVLDGAGPGVRTDLVMYKAFGVFKVEFAYSPVTGLPQFAYAITFLHPFGSY